MNNRLKQWAKKCHRKLKLLNQWHVKNHEFSEAMIHCELKIKNYWYGKTKCNFCKCFHIELFHGDIEEITEIVKFWVSFFNNWHNNWHNNWV